MVHPRGLGTRRWSLGVRRHDPRTSVLAEVLEDPFRGKLPGRTHHAPAGMGSGAALVVAVNRGAVLAPAGSRPEEVHLWREELPGEDVPLGQPDLPLDIERRDDLAMEDQVAEAREER